MRGLYCPHVSEHAAGYQRMSGDIFRAWRQLRSTSIRTACRIISHRPPPGPKVYGRQVGPSPVLQNMLFCSDAYHASFSTHAFRLVLGRTSPNLMNNISSACTVAGGGIFTMPKKRFINQVEATHSTPPGSSRMGKTLEWMTEILCSLFLHQCTRLIEQRLQQLGVS